MGSQIDEKYTRYSVFSIANNLFGLEILAVKEVLPIPKVTILPNVTSHILGVYNLRGTINTLIDIGYILGLDVKENPETDMVLLLESNKVSFSFKVERVLDFIEVENSEVQLPTRNISARIAHFIRGTYKSDEMGSVFLFDTDKFLNFEEIFSGDNH